MTENTPDRARTRFPGISSRAYEHPADRSALVALRSLSGFDVVLRKMSGLINERSLRLMFLGGTVRVGEDQFRHIHDMVRDACYILDMPEVPELLTCWTTRSCGSSSGTRSGTSCPGTRCTRR